MSNPFEFSNSQQAFPFLRGPGPWWWGRQLWSGYRLPYCDANDIRRLDSTRVGALGEQPFRWAIASDRVGVISSQVPWNGNMQYAAGSPIQRAHPTRAVPVYERDKDYKPRDFTIPAPIAGFLWVEGNPWPAWRSASAGADLHARIIADDGSSYEMFGAVPNHSAWGLNSITCKQLARYDAEGNLHPNDRHVTRGPVQLSALLLGRAEPMHRLGLVVRGNDADEGTLDEIGQWVALDARRVPWDELTPDANRLANCLTTFGAITFDHGGHTGIGCVAGADWAGVRWGGWAPKLGDFRRVTAEA